MKRVLASFKFAVSAVLASSLLAASPAEARHAEAKARMAALFADFAKLKSPGCAYAVREGGKPVAQGAFGAADINKKQPLTSDRLMNIGSVSKSFTAAAVLRLIRDGKLKSTDSLAQHFPDLPAWAARVTIADLVYMRSGIPDLFVRGSDGARVDNTEGGNLLFGTTKTLFDKVSFGDLYKSIASNPSLAFAPGSKYNYSNSNYVLLAKLVEKTSGMGLQDYLRRHVMPRALKKRVYVAAGNAGLFSVPGGATGYYKAEGSTSWSPRAEGWDVRGPSNVWISVADLAKWADHYSSNLGVADSFQSQAAVPGIFTGEGKDRAGYAYGLFATNIGSEDVIYHPGGTEQFTAGVYAVPSKRLSFAYACNIRAQELVAALSSGAGAEAIKAYGYDVVFRSWIGK